MGKPPEADTPDPWAGTEFEGMVPEKIYVDAETFDKFLAYLDRPAKHLPGMEALALAKELEHRPDGQGPR